MVSSLYEIYNLYDPPIKCQASDFVIVLDMDQTLLCTYDDKSLLESSGIRTQPEDIDIRSRLYILNVREYEGKRGSGTITTWWGLFRPRMKEFLKYCFNKYKHVVVWSAGEYDYVHAACKEIFKGLPKPDLILTRDDCTTHKEGRHEYYIKPLTKIIDHPGLSKGLDLSKIFIVDDRPYTFIPNPANGILIPEYNPEERAGKSVENKKWMMRLDDTRLEELMYFLENIKGCDIRLVDKTRIFGT